MNKIVIGKENCVDKINVISSINNRMAISYDGLDKGFMVKAFIRRYLNDGSPKWFNEALLEDIERSLQGLEDRMALEIIDDVLDFSFGQVLHWSGLTHIDEILARLYGRVLYLAREKNVQINCSFV